MSVVPLRSTRSLPGSRRAGNRGDLPVVLDTRVVQGSGGGPDKTILNSPRFLLPAGYRMLCAYMHPPNDPGFEQIRQKARRWKAPLMAVEDRGPWDWRVLSQFLQICRRERVAIWHGHDYKSNLLGLLLRPFWPMRLVTTVHGWVHETTRTSIYYGIDRLCLPRYEQVICVSQDLLEQCVAAKVQRSRCILIENGIDLEEFRRRQPVERAKKQLLLPHNRPMIGAAGRLSPEKGYDVLLRAVQMLLQKGVDAELAIVGEGDQRPELERLAAELGIKERVSFLGYQADPRDWYEAMDLFVLSSLREGLPNVVLEAMALEVPVVATRIAGVPNVISDGENGLLVEAGSAQRLADAVGRLLLSPELRARLGSAGRSTIESRYGFAARMQKIRALYDRMLQGAS